MSRGDVNAGILTILAMFAYFNFIHRRLDLYLAQTTSQNIIAGISRPLPHYVTDENKGPAFLVCAHYDTPRNFPTWFTYLRKPMRWLMPTAMLGMLVFGVWALIYALQSLAGDSLGAFLNPIATVLGWITFITTMPVLTLGILATIARPFSKKTDSPGADDNGSGTAMVLALAERFKANPPENMEIYFAWWGAEERGLFGSRQFVRRFHQQLDRDKLYLINADCVGVGDLLTIHMGQGTWRRKATNPAIADRLERLAGERDIRTIRTWESAISGGSSDHAGWIDRGYQQSVSFLRENAGGKLTPPAQLYAKLMRIPYANQLELNHIHTADDVIAGINPIYLAQTTELAEAYIREIDSEFKSKS